MRSLVIITTVALLGGCTQTPSDNEYWCSYEQTEQAYKTCMDVAEGVDKDTVEAAGQREDDNR